MSVKSPAGAETCQVRCVHPEAVAGTRALLADDATYVRLAELFGALSDATRARIVHSLLQQELCTCDIAAVVGITESGASQHLRVLRSLRLVQSRRAGKYVYYTLDDAHVALLVQVGLAHDSDNTGVDAGIGPNAAVAATLMTAGQRAGRSSPGTDGEAE